MEETHWAGYGARAHSLHHLSGLTTLPAFLCLSTWNFSKPNCWKFSVEVLCRQECFNQWHCWLNSASGSLLSPAAAAKSLQSDSVRPHRRQPTRLPHPSLPYWSLKPLNPALVFWAQASILKLSRHWPVICHLAQMVKNLPAIQETRVQSLDQEDPWRRKWQPTPVFLLGESVGQRSLVGYSPWGCKESDMT